MALPILILTIACLAAAMVAYGTDAGWGQFDHGLQWIMFSRRWQWPLIATVLICALLVIGLIVSGRWRAWWLIGLLPIAALFFHRFAADASRSMQINEQASFVSASVATFVNNDDYVIGLTFGSQAYAYPFNVLYQSPVIVTSRRDKRLLLVWSAFANRALAVTINQSLKPHELEIVSVPANALLLYNTRQGQFINGVTAQTPQGATPAGFELPIATVKMPWQQWKSLHPDTLVLQPGASWQRGLPSAPVKPYYPMPGKPHAGTARVALIQGNATLAKITALVSEPDVSGGPLNLVAGRTPLLMYRANDGQIRAFLRQANGDLTPRFFPAPANIRPTNVIFTEADSKTGWAADGRAVAGPLVGEKLAPFLVEDDVNQDVARYWFPDAVMLKPTVADIGKPPAAAETVAVRSTHLRSPRRLRRVRAS